MQKCWHFIERRPVVTVVGWAVLLRALFFGFYSHVSLFPDAFYYRDLATYMAKWDLTGYTGERTPGYPAVIALMGEQLWAVVFVQMVLGVFTTFLVYDTARLLLTNKGIAAITAMFYTSFLFVLFFEFAILTESLSIFLLQAIVWFIVRNKLLESLVALHKYMLLAMLIALLFMTRPMFIYVPILFSLFYCWNFLKTQFFKTITVTVLLCGTTYMTQIGWQHVNYENTGYCQTTYFMGYNLMQMATHFFEKIPDEHAQVRDILLQYRQRAQDSLPAAQLPMTVWHAQDALLLETGLSKQELGAYFKELAIPLFKENKAAYAQQVGWSFCLFWGSRSHFLWNKEAMQPVFMQKVVVGISYYLQSPLLILLNLCFLIASGFVLWQLVRSRFKFLDTRCFLVCLVLAAACAQALVAYGDNSRFAFPFFGIVVVVAVDGIGKLFSK